MKTTLIKPYIIPVWVRKAKVKRYIRGVFHICYFDSDIPCYGPS